MNLRIATFFLLLFAFGVTPVAAQTDVYDNGPTNGTTDGWTINFGFAVSNSFLLGSDTQVSGLNFAAWLFPGDVLLASEVLITSSEFGGTVYFDDNVLFTQSGCVANQYGYNVCHETGSFSTGMLNPGTYWLTLQNAIVNDDPVYWDENSGPSSASQNSLGTIPSESFTILGTATTTTSNETLPEPNTLILLASAALTVTGLAKRKLY
jgi:hypothetical protein